MPISSEALKQDLDQLTQDQLRQVADFIAFLKFRDRHRRRLTLNPSQVTALAKFPECSTVAHLKQQFWHESLVSAAQRRFRNISDWLLTL